MGARFFLLIILSTVSQTSFAGGCFPGMPCWAGPADTGSSGNRAAPPVTAPPAGPLTPDQCKQKEPIQWGLRFTYFRTVWAVVAVKCSSIPGTGVDKDQYRQFTITHNRDYVEIENYLGKASKSTNYSQEGRAERLRRQQESNNENARLLGKSALPAEELPWSEQYEAIGKYSEITTKMNEEEYDLARSAGEAAYCKAKSPDYRRAMAYSPQELHQRLADCVCENRGCETGSESGGTLTPAAGRGGGNGGPSGNYTGAGVGGGSGGGNGGSGTTVVHSYDGRRPSTVVRVAPATAPPYRPRPADGGGDGGSPDNRGGANGDPTAGPAARPPVEPAPGTAAARPPAAPAPVPQPFADYTYKTCTRPRAAKPLPLDEGQAAYVLLQSEAFLWAYSSVCKGTAPQNYSVFISVNDEVIAGAKTNISKQLTEKKLKVEDLIAHLHRVEAAKAGGSTTTIERYCQQNARRFETLIATNRQTQQDDTRTLEAAVCVR